MASNFIDISEESLNSLTSKQELILNKLNQTQIDFNARYDAVVLLVDTLFDRVSGITEKFVRFGNFSTHAF